MRILPPGLQQHLDSGVTTLCHCWRLTLGAGEVMGFTDHDRDVVFDGVRYEAAAGFTATEVESATGFAVDNMEAAGALSSGRLDAARLSAGDFDHARVELWRVNWTAPEERLLMKAGELGEVSHGPLGFTAELRGLAHALGAARGRLYQFGCDAEAGDARCGINLEAAGFVAQAVVSAVAEGRFLTVSGIAGHAAGWFSRGTMVVTSGANRGRRFVIKRHSLTDGAAQIELWQAPLVAIGAGDGLALCAGCDKQFATCRDKFANTENFRGFPHMPGNDFVLSFAQAGGAGQDGQSRNR